MLIWLWSPMGQDKGWRDAEFRRHPLSRRLLRPRHWSVEEEFVLPNTAQGSLQLGIRSRSNGYVIQQMARSAVTDPDNEDEMDREVRYLGVRS